MQIDVNLKHESVSTVHHAPKIKTEANSGGIVLQNIFTHQHFQQQQCKRKWNISCNNKSQNFTSCFNLNSHQKNEVLVRPSVILKKNPKITKHDPSQSKTTTSCNFSSTLPKCTSVKDFQLVKFVAHGAFGRVYSVIEKQTGRQMAMKQIYQNHRYANREGDICSQVNHPCIVKFHHIFYEKHGLENYLHLVMDEYPMTLQNFFDQCTKRDTCIPESKIKLYTLQILLGLQHLHAKGIAHRDLKPENLLLNPERDKLVICDLGSAKRVTDGTYNKAYICSRLYRAPELLCGCENYTPKLDIWSAGCIMGECYLLRPLFPGNDTKQQLKYIQRLLGPLTRKEKNILKEGTSNYFVQVKFSNWEDALQLHAKTPLSSESIYLIKQMLQFDSHLRSTSHLLIQSRYFQNVTSIPN